ncbi:MAG: flagellar biosynthesis protein FliP [Crocinitomicaceae bacterium]|jgi:flagellar biosynthesis protein FliP
MHNSEVHKTNCRHCGKKLYRNINDIYAKESKLMIAIVTILTVVGLVFSIVILMGYFKVVPIVGMFTALSLPLVPGIAFGIYKREERTRINSFNRGKV